MTHDISYSDFGIETKKDIPNKNIQYVYAIMLNEISGDIFLNDKIDAEISDNKISISFKNIKLFLNNSLMNTDESEVLFFELGEIFKKIDNKVIVYSYLDDANDNAVISGAPLKKALILSKLLKKYSPDTKIEASFAVRNLQQKDGKEFILFVE